MEIIAQDFWQSLTGNIVSMAKKIEVDQQLNMSDVAKTTFNDAIDWLRKKAGVALGEKKA